MKKRKYKLMAAALVQPADAIIILDDDRQMYAVVVQEVKVRIESMDGKWFTAITLMTSDNRSWECYDWSKLFVSQSNGVFEMR